MKSLLKFTFLIFTLIYTQFSFSQNQPATVAVKQEPLSIGDRVTIHSTILDEDRVLNVYLPYGYHPDSIKQYPVIYLLDGSIYEDFLHIAGLVQFGAYPWVNSVPESIVVGIENIDRKKDFTYQPNNKEYLNEFPTSGHSENFISFLEKELQPFINSNYKTDTLSTIIGQSLGGLVATEILLKQPNLFDHYMIISPSLWWDDQSLLALKPKPYTGKKSIYIAVGKEGKIMEKTARKLHKIVKAEANENTHLSFDYLKNQDHANILHLAAYRGFKKIYRLKPIEY